jgi:putative spermidine/putrescine transport system substrate-binding protein
LELARRPGRPRNPLRTGYLTGSLRPIIGLVALALVATACGAPGGTGGSSTSFKPADVPAKPEKAVTLNVLDVAGNLQLTQGMIDEFVSRHGDVVSRVNYSKATAPELAGKIQAQQNANRVDIDLVLTGTDGLSAGIAKNLWLPLLPDYASRFPNLTENYLEPAAKMQELAQGQGVELTYYPSGPLLEYDPAKVPNPPTSTDELLAWAKAHPGRFMYARPANSGPGRTLLMGLPYILGDSDPKDPTNGWDKTWAYLKELGKYVPTYPTKTSETMKNLANGTVDMIATTTGWDINPRALGQVPADMKITTLKGFHFVTDAHYGVVPKGVSSDKLSAVLNLMQWMLTPEQQAKAFDAGYFYPGPAVKGVTLSMAPAKSQQLIQQFGRPEYDKLIAETPKETSLPAEQQVAAFNIWDRDVGSGKFKTS